ncbi:hypothetical protein GCM10010198_25190 [Nocardia seriolae]|nr:hypothetical protein NSERKGN1266_02840 [Nocardia seriolae]BEK84373.1 hypothetical protein NSERKGN1266_03240 [Nocardia seriolae]BEK84413.1 hypothetical protein NSERKGN1266_03640 [Nocardia seriolae]BEK92370.1 hypothetical protein NSER024013_02760 [Nocardia seriolae]GEM25429.1 hypothetical protein NS2_36680 [Nocardia seriolae NBRC 15557]
MTFEPAVTVCSPVVMAERNSTAATTNTRIVSRAPTRPRRGGAGRTIGMAPVGGATAGGGIGAR